MTPRRSIFRPAALAAALLCTAAAGAAAQDRPLFRWTGRVDREVRLVMHGRSLDARLASWTERLGDRTRVFNVLPPERGWVSVRVTRGRGRVDVVQQPDARNGFTAVIRIRDAAPGADFYDVSAFWTPAGGRWDEGGWQPGDRDDRPDRGNRDGGWNGPDPGGRNLPDRGWNGGAWNAQHGTLRWSGMVDDEVELRIQGDRVQTYVVSGRGARDVRADLSGAMPRRDTDLRVDKRRGRGQVRVLQEPSARNGYTAVLRIRDPRAGADYYDLDVSW